MERLAEVLALLALFVGLAGPAVTLWKSRKTTGSEVALTGAQAYDKLTASVDRQDARLEAQRDEIDELRNRVHSLEGEGIERDRRVAQLEGEVGTLTRYLRRLVNQLRNAGIVPDIPASAIEQLFKENKK